jgi:predicted permease
MLRRLRSFFRKGRVESELDAELRFHLEKQVELNIQRGMNPREARYAATRTFGGVEQVKEECRDARGLAFVETLVQDIRYGLRMMRKNPVFTVVAVVSLALGIGANTAIFSLMDAVMIRSLPVAEPQRLVLLRWVSKDWPKTVLSNLNGSSWRDEVGRTVSSSFSYDTFQHLRAQGAPVLSGIAAFADQNKVTATMDGRSETAEGQLVSGNFWSVLGVNATLGRVFTDSDDQPGAVPAAVISHRYWTRRFARDPSVLGRNIIVNGVALTIVGITPAEFFGMYSGRSPDIFLPLTLQPRIEETWSGDGRAAIGLPDYWWTELVARLKPGVSTGEANARLDPLFRQSIVGNGPAPADLPGLMLAPGGQGGRNLRTRFSKPLYILMAVVGLVLLIACANVASLLVAKASARKKEAAVRLALGASRSRLIRQLLTENMMLACLGGAAGLLLANWGARLLVALVPRSSTPLVLDVAPNFHVLIFSIAISILTSILFGLAPAIHSTRLDLTPALKQAPAYGASSRRLGFGGALVAVQLALSLVVLTGASLFVRTLVNLNSVELGFDRRNLLLFSMDGTLSSYKGSAVTSLYERIRESIAAHPAVESVTLSGHRLIGGGGRMEYFLVKSPAMAERKVDVWLHLVGARFFETMRVPLLVGRGIRERDDGSAPRIAVVNEAFVRQFLKGVSPVGERVRWESAPEAGDIEIVGVVRNAKYAKIQDDAPATLYLPYLQHPSAINEMSFEVRTVGNPLAIATDVRRAVAAIDKNVPLSDMQTQVQQIDRFLMKERLFATLSAAFGVLALVLAAIGLYGTISYAAARRTSEIGIRMALGASRSSVLWLILRGTLAMLAVGILVGLPASLAAAQLVRSQLFGLSAMDPASLAGAVVILGALAMAAGWIPARRAARVDPMTALRYE